MKKSYLWLALSLFTIVNLQAQNWSEIIKATGSDRAANDRFGVSVAISGDYAIVGAYLESEDATGNNTLSQAGSAYIFKNDAGTWIQMQKIVASDRAVGDNFGYSVAISGGYAIVGAYRESEDATGNNTLTQAGSAYIFKKDAGSWSQVQKIVASDRGGDDLFGWSVAMSGDYAIVGAYFEDEDVAGNNTLSGAGSAYIFKNDVGTWIQMQKIVASDRALGDRFGWSVAINGVYAFVGAHFEGEDAAGQNTLSRAGSAYIFKNTSGIWSQVQKIVASDRATSDFFGYSVAISGDYAIVGAYFEDEDAAGQNTLNGAGSAYIFKNTSGIWSQMQKIIASDRAANDRFGSRVAINGVHAIVGVFLEDEDAVGNNTLSAAGSAYLFKNNAGTWGQIQKIVASDRAANDRFGFSVSISGDYAIVGAYFEDEDAAGQNTVSEAGSAYIFNNTIPTIGLSGNNHNIAYNATPELSNSTDFGKLASGGTVTKTYTITNNGFADLTLSGAPFVTLMGSTDFSVTTQPALTTLTPGASTTFQVTFTPSGSGQQTAQVTIASNDPNNNPFIFEIQGATNTAMDFDGGNDYINLPYNFDGSLTEFTVEAWVNCEGTSGTLQSIFSNTGANFVHFQLFGDGTSGNNVIYTSPTTAVLLPMVPETPYGLWKHVALVAKSGDSKIFVNGVQLGATATGAFSGIPINNSNRIGSGWASGRFFNGQLDEVRIWNRALCQAEIQGRMNSSLQGNENGLVAYYDFEEGVPSGTNTGLTEVKDKANNHHGTLTNFSKTGTTSNWVNGVALTNGTTAMDFDGVNDQVFLSNVNPGTSAITIESWIKLDALPAGLNNPFAGIYDSQSDGFVFYLDKGNNELKFKVSTSGTSLRPGIPASSLTTGNWLHIAGVYNGATNSASIYLNGDLINILTNPSLTGTVNQNQNVAIGSGFNQYYFQGQIDEVRIWNRALTQAEIQANMNKKLRGDETGLVTYYDFEDGTPEGNNSSLTTILDKAGSNNGTLNGFAKTGASSNWVGGYSNIESGGITGTLMTWNGTTSTDWNTTTNWTPNGIPDQCTDVIIPITASNPTFSNNQAVNGIEVLSGASLTVGAGGCLWVGSTFTNNGAFILNATASSYAQYLGPQVTGTLQQVFGEAGWHNIASPFIDATLGDIVFDNGAFLQYDNSGQPNIYYYDPGVHQVNPPGTWANAWGSWVGATDGNDPFDGSRAYNIYFDDLFVTGNFTTVTLSVTGTLRNMPITLQLNEANGGWNQLSNPFPSVIDWEKWSDNSAISNTYYVWDATLNSFYTYMTGGTSVPVATLTPYIAPYQSVFIKTTNGLNTNSGDEPDVFQNHLTSNADRPTTCPAAINNFYKTTVTGLLYIEAKTNDQKYSDQLAIRFGNGFSPGFVTDEEAVKFFSPKEEVPSIFTIIEDRAFVISSFPEPGAVVESIPLGLQTKVGQSISFVATEIPEGVTAILEDKLEKTYTNLKKSYSFKSTKTIDNNRFVLHLGDEYFTKSDISRSGDLLAFINNGELKFMTNPSLDGGDVELINMSIQTLVKAKYSSETTIDVSSYPAGVYLIIVKKRGEVFRQKIVIQ